MAKLPATSSIRKHLLAFRRSLAALDRSLARLTTALDGFGTAATPRRQSTRKLSPRGRAALKLQGKYMGFMRRLKPKQKAEVRAVKEKKGIEAAIKRAQMLAGKHKDA